MKDNLRQRPIEIEDCLQALKEAVRPIEGSQPLPCSKALGRILAEDVYAPVAVPSFPRSAMDGYAVFHGDTVGASSTAGKTLKVKGIIYAGDYKEVRYEQATCLRVMTGAYIPEGYDAVIKQEDTDMAMDHVTIYKEAKAYENYCKAGEDIKKESLLLTAGTIIGPLELGLLASVGIDRVNLKPKARIGIISTGSELLEAGQDQKAGKIYGSLTPYLVGAIEKAGMSLEFQASCVDAPREAQRLIEKALEASDIVITTGAISVGERDFIPSLLDNMGAEVIFSGADIQPGTPTMAAKLAGKVILCLSGNPFAAIANFEIYFWDLMAHMTGSCELETKKDLLEMAEDYDKVNKRRRLIRARADKDKVYLPASEHQASIIYNMRECNCLIDLEAGRRICKGDKVRVRYLKGI